jgi:hypothetical protein
MNGKITKEPLSSSAASYYRNYNASTISLNHYYKPAAAATPQSDCSIKYQIIDLTIIDREIRALGQIRKLSPREQKVYSVPYFI